MLLLVCLGLFYFVKILWVFFMVRIGLGMFFGEFLGVVVVVVLLLVVFLLVVVFIV